MTAKEFDHLHGELAEIRAEEERRRAEVNVRTEERMRALELEAELMNPRVVGDDFWPEWETE